MTDSVRTYSPEEKQRLTTNLTALVKQIHAGVERRVDLTLVRDLHAALFDGVRDHAGRHRDVGFGSETLTFGPNVSVHRERVQRELRAMFEQFDRRAAAVSDQSTDYESHVIALAVWLHAEIVRIHPFEDGNGRTSRLIANHVLVRHGLLPVAIEAVKQEYTDALNLYFSQKDLQPLTDLYVGLYPLRTRT